MPNPKAPRARVLRSVLHKLHPAEVLAACDAVYAAGNICPQVVASPGASAVLASLKAATDQFRASHGLRTATAIVLKVQIGTANNDETSLAFRLRSYMSVVDDLADGDAVLIHNAGLLSRVETPGAVSLDMPTAVTSVPGKKPMQAIVRWKAGPGASSYLLEANFTPNVPGSAWTPLAPGRSRRRTVVAPTPGAQFLLRIASIGGDAQSDWTSPVLVTTR